jgi:hypothetical protein
MVVLGDEAQVEAHFGTFGDSANCWETIPSWWLAWLEGTSAGVRAEVEEEWA